MERMARPLMVYVHQCIFATYVARFHNASFADLFGVPSGWPDYRYGLDLRLTMSGSGQTGLLTVPSPAVDSHAETDRAQKDTANPRVVSSSISSSVHLCLSNTSDRDRATPRHGQGFGAATPPSAWDNRRALHLTPTAQD